MKRARQQFYFVSHVSPFLLTGSRLLPAPAPWPLVPDVHRGDPEVWRRRAPLCPLHKRVLLLREGHRTLAGQEEAAGDPRHPGADGGRGAGRRAGINVRGRGMRGASKKRKHFFILTHPLKVYDTKFTRRSHKHHRIQRSETLLVLLNAFTNISKHVLERTVEP